MAGFAKLILTLSIPVWALWAFALFAGVGLAYGDGGVEGVGWSGLTALLLTFVGYPVLLAAVFFRRGREPAISHRPDERRNDDRHSKS